MQAITIRTKFGKVEKVPIPNWKEITVYWLKIAKAFFEVFDGR